MTNKFVLVSIIWIFALMHWLDMSMGNLRLVQLGMKMYIYPHH